MWSGITRYVIATALAVASILESGYPQSSGQAQQAIFFSKVMVFHHQTNSTSLKFHVFRGIWDCITHSRYTSSQRCQVNCKTTCRRNSCYTLIIGQHKMWKKVMSQIIPGSPHGLVCQGTSKDFLQREKWKLYLLQVNVLQDKILFVFCLDSCIMIYWLPRCDNLYALQRCTIDLFTCGTREIRW